MTSKPTKDTNVSVDTNSVATVSETPIADAVAAFLCQRQPFATDKVALVEKVAEVERQLDQAVRRAVTSELDLGLRTQERDQARRDMQELRRELEYAKSLGVGGFLPNENTICTWRVLLDSTKPNPGEAT